MAVLALLAFLIYKQWNAVTAGAKAVAQRAGIETQQTAAVSKPAPVVTGSDQIDASQGAVPAAPVPHPTKGEDVASEKPESDQGSVPMEVSPTKESGQIRATTTKKEEVLDEIVTGAEPNAAKAATAPSEPRLDDSRVEAAQRYLRGEGVAQDCGHAISLLRLSAREGNTRAQIKLGALYATGQCVTQDRAAAYQWLARAQENEPRNSHLQRTMNSLWMNMTPEDRSRITK